MISVTPRAFAVCQELTLVLTKTGNEYGPAPDMTGKILNGNVSRSMILNYLIKKGVLKKKGEIPFAQYAFRVPVKDIREELPKGGRPVGAKNKKSSQVNTSQVDTSRKEKRIPLRASSTLRKPSLYLVNDFMNFVNKKSVELNEHRNIKLQRQTEGLKEQLFSLPADSDFGEEYRIIRELYNVATERKSANSSVLLQAIQEAKDTAYREYDFSFLSSDPADYADA